MIPSDRTQIAPPGAGPPGREPASDPTRVAFPERFQIIKRLGAGGMAEVFVAYRHEADGSRRPVVIKRPLPELAAHPEFLDMFLDEAKIASAIVHPNVVRVEEVVSDAEGCLLVMELVDGKPLSAVMARVERRKQRLEARLAAHLVARAAEGLHYAHELCDAEGRPMQLVHRDVSPQNVLVSFDGAVKVIDFGIARALGRVTRTRTGTRKGKTGYMSPEQARSVAMDRRVDVFALGILLWELLCGRRLFVRPDEYRAMNALLLDPIPRPSRFVAVAPELESIVMRALEREPDRRYPTAEELRTALDAYVASLGKVSRTELSRTIHHLFPAEPSLVPSDNDHSGAGEIGPAVVSKATRALRQGLAAPRSEVLWLGLGAVGAAGFGGLLGWLGKRLRSQPEPRVAGTSAAGSSLPAPAPTRAMGYEPLPRKEIPVAAVEVPVPPATAGPPVSPPPGERPRQDRARRPAPGVSRRKDDPVPLAGRKKNPF